jgi:hypothetical protein
VDRHGIRALTHFRCRCARFGRHCTGDACHGIAFGRCRRPVC